MYDQANRDIVQAWQTQPASIGMSPLTTALLRRAAHRYMWVNALGKELLGMVSMTAIGLYFTIIAIGGQFVLCRLGAALMAGAAFFDAYRIFSARTRFMPPNIGATDCLNYYRTELLRKRDFFLHYKIWGVSPFTPGIVVGSLGWWLSAPQEWATALGLFAVAFALNLLHATCDHNRVVDLEAELKLLDAQ